MTTAQAAGAAGFLTRLIALHEMGPNVATRSPADYERETQSRQHDVERVWECALCLDSHDSYTDAKECCDHTASEEWFVVEGMLMACVIFKCAACKLAYESKRAAETCCEYVALKHECPDCSDLHSAMQDAVCCCLAPPEVIVRGQSPQCMVCLQEVAPRSTMSKSDAVEWWTEAARCCLPVKHPTISSHDCAAIGALLARGVTWSAAMEQVEGARQ